MLALAARQPGQGYRFLASVHGADYLPAEPRFGVHYELLNMRARRAHRACKALRRRPRRADALPEIDSCVELFPTADFQEREVYDMFGDRLPRPPRPAPDPDARGLRGLARSAATSRSAASRSSSRTTRPTTPRWFE